MSEYIEVGQSLQFTDPNTPTRVGEIVESVSDIYNIPSPRLGMQVFVKSEKKSFVITSLKSKVINGVDVPEAAVEAFEPVGAKSITWNNDTFPSNMNDFTIAGVYDIKGERTRVNDNLPILNTGGGHSFNARLTVLDSSISGSGKGDDKCITQVLSFSNRLGQGEVYIRTGKGSSLNNLSWENWSTLQRNVNVVSVESLDDLIDNGIYSGVLNPTGETFVLVVINNYALASKYGTQRCISQFKYSVNYTGAVVLEKRVKIGDSNWGSWQQTNEEWLNARFIELEDSIFEYIDKEIQDIIEGTNPDTIDSIKDLVSWVEKHGADAAKIIEDINKNTEAINNETEARIKDVADEKSRAEQAEEEIMQNTIAADTIGCSTTTTDMSLKFEALDGKSSGSVTFPAATTKKAGVMSAGDKTKLDSLPSEIEKIKDGNTIVGQARELHSRNGKTVTDSFLVRTTAGSGTIGDGVASLKSVGGNIVKNLVDGTFTSRWSGPLVKISDGVAVITPRQNYDSSRYNNIPCVANHKYYIRVSTYTPVRSSHYIAIIGYGDTTKTITTIYRTSPQEQWGNVTYILTASAEFSTLGLSISSDANTGVIATAKPYFIDLTEMFGAGKEPDKATCDKLFGTMDALPQGLSIANPTEFKSTGFNQFNPDNVLEGKAIVDNAIVNGDKKIAVIPCLPCKVGTGENNGYCIHGDFGDDIKVYLTPLNPKDVDGELYMHELAKDATTDTYVPLIKGYMLVEVPTTANLCAHFLWSEDKCERDTYEPHFENKIELPVIPQMSEWGLAGIQSSGTLACDEIDLERGVYVKRVKRVYIDTFRIYPKDNNVYELEFISTDNINKRSVLCPAYATDKADGVTSNKPDKCIYPSNISTHNRFYIVDSSIADVASLKEAMKDVPIYVELATPEEYPLPKVDNNYISSDYGVEQFDSSVPCNANNLYYMRSLTGETRNFLDRLYDNTDKTNAKEVADYITNGIEGNKELATNAPNLALRALLVAAGAEYNDSGIDKSMTTPWGETVTHKAGHYYLNGLGDITESQMLRIYNRGNFNDADIAPLSDKFSYANNIRTNLPRVGPWNGNLQPYLSGSNSRIEVITLHVARFSVADICNINFANTESLFIGSSAMSVIDTRCRLVSSAWSGSSFKDCISLKEVRIEKLKNNLVFAQSSQISKASVLFAIEKATPTSAITITLHADAYARLANDADIVAALEAQPLVTLVSA